VAVRPLDGIRVVDLSWIVAGPQCTRVLADFGAEVIRVENEQTLDSLRFGRPHPKGLDPPNSSGFFNTMNRNKRSITLNARHPAGIEVLKDLIAKSDVLVENFSSRVLERWGLSYAELQAVRQDIIYLSISGFGHSGRDRDFTTWGPTAQALSGLTLMSGLPGEEPAGWGYSYMDHQAGYLAAVATLSALRHRQRTGEGQHIDMSQVEAGMTLCGPAFLDYTVNGRSYRRPENPPGNGAAWPKAAPHNTYRCVGEDAWVMITCLSHTHWAALCDVIGHGEWQEDDRFATLPARLRHTEVLDQLIGEWTADRDATAVMEAMQAVGVPAGVVQNLPAIIDEDPQMQARGFTALADHPYLGEHRTDGTPAHLSRTPATRAKSSPLLGEDNDFVYRELLGYSEEKMSELREIGTFG
jgi:crotonobetainyl-CoA:carnitine CoA-transferase CaiB-like acyl-CoA transferase